MSHDCVWRQLSSACVGKPVVPLVQVAIEQGRQAAADSVKHESENKAYKQANEARFISRIPECTEFDALYATTVATIISNTNATNVYVALMELGEDDLVWPVIPPDPDSPEAPPEPEAPKEEPAEGEDGEENPTEMFQEKPPPGLTRNAYLGCACAPPPHTHTHTHTHTPNKRCTRVLAHTSAIRTHTPISAHQGHSKAALRAAAVPCHAALMCRAYLPKRLGAVPSHW